MLTTNCPRPVQRPQTDQWFAAALSQNDLAPATEGAPRGPKVSTGILTILGATYRRWPRAATVLGLLALGVGLSCSGGGNGGRTPTQPDPTLVSYVATLSRYGKVDAVITGTAFASWSGGRTHPVSLANNMVRLSGLPSNRLVTYTLAASSDRLGREGKNTWTESSAESIVRTYPNDPPAMEFVNGEAESFSTAGGKAVADQNVFSRSDVLAIEASFRESEECFGLRRVNVVRGDLATPGEVFFVIAEGPSASWDGSVLRLMPTLEGLVQAGAGRARVAGVENVYAGGITEGLTCSRAELEGARIIIDCQSDRCP